MFSPYYARARRNGGGDPLEHCAINVALYGAGGKRWALTERNGRALQRSRFQLGIGPSALNWDGNVLTARIDEVTAPFPSHLRGTVRVHPAALPGRSFPLDAGGRHIWTPISPCARVEVAMERPALRWSGSAYFDANAGSEPLEAGFRSWDWSRAELRDGTAVLYDAVRRDGSKRLLALRFGPDGSVASFDAPPPVRLPPATVWRVDRATRADAGHGAAVMETLEDTPFYTRSLLRTHLLSERAMAVHESLSLDRFRTGWVQALLPFRMPRVPL